jgi:very-short-patch-repair endonuclease
MDPQRFHSSVWEVARRQHGVVSRAQLIALGFRPDAIKHRLRRGRLHPVHRGVYAVGRPELTQHGRWMAAVLSCGSGALLSHSSAAALWGIAKQRGSAIHVTVPVHSRRRSSPGVTVHRRTELRATAREGIPTTTPIDTLVDLATRTTRDQLEAAVNEADKHDLVDPEALRAAVDQLRRAGAKRLRDVLDRRTFTLTASELERRFLPIARRAGLPLPETGATVNGFDVDFLWPDLRLVVETDGLRYHRTPAQQARDRLRDQAHAAAGYTPLRFTRAQVRYDPAHVKATLKAVAVRLVAA